MGSYIPVHTMGNKHIIIPAIENSKRVYTPTPPPWWGTFGSMRRGRFFHHKIHIKHQDLAQKDGRYNMVMLITREMDE